MKNDELRSVAGEIIEAVYDVNFHKAGPKDVSEAHDRIVAILARRAEAWIPVSQNRGEEKRNKTPNPSEYSEDCLELFDEDPHFLHSEFCGGWCDYACNPAGFEQAEYILAMERLFRKPSPQPEPAKSWPNAYYSVGELKAGERFYSNDQLFEVTENLPDWPRVTVKNVAIGALTSFEKDTTVLTAPKTEPAKGEWRVDGVWEGKNGIGSLCHRARIEISPNARLVLYCLTKEEAEQIAAQIVEDHLHESMSRKTVLIQKQTIESLKKDVEYFLKERDALKIKDKEQSNLLKKLREVMDELDRLKEYQWRRTCIHHTDEERADVKDEGCPVCSKAELERLKLQVLKLQNDLRISEMTS
jgi:hypothetical protein